MVRKLFIAVVLAACALPAFSLRAAADEHKFTINNKGGHQIDKVYLSPISSDHWGPDQMGDDVIAPGASQTWNIDQDCELDVKVVYHDGNVVVKKDVDTCKYDLDMDY